jgi:hypothetical protein
VVSPLPSNSAATDGGAVNVAKTTDETTITVTDNVVNKPVSLVKQGITDNVTDSVIDAKNSVTNNKAKKGMCEFCSAEFDKKVSWKRFCCDDCRIKAWELKHGKKLVAK